MKALVTGADGFIGVHLCERLEREGWTVLRSQRSGGRADFAVDLATIDPQQMAAQSGPLDVVFHLAGRAHRRADAATYERDNVETTRRAWQWAQRAGARRFVFLSTIRVLGDVSRHPFRIGDPRRPGDAYAESKAEAEVYLEEVAGDGPAVTIVRPPLVYGPGVGANFLRLMQAAVRGWPLPLGRAAAPRSQVAVGNLIDLLVRCCADNRGLRVLHVRDERDYAVADLVRALATAAGRSPRLLQIPPSLVRAALAVVGRARVSSRLFAPAQIDDRATRAVFGWKPPIESQQALLETVAWWQRSRS